MLLHEKLSEIGKKHLKDILKDIERGKTNKKIYSGFKQRNIEYPKEDFTNDMRKIKKADREYSDIELMHKNKPMDKKYYRPSTILSDKKYMTKFLVRQYDIDEKKYETKFFTLTHDKLYTLKLLENRLTPEYIKRNTKGKSDPNIEIKSIKPIQGYYNY